MNQVNNIPVEVVDHYNALHSFLNSGFVAPDRIDFVRMEIAMIERDVPDIKVLQ